MTDPAAPVSDASHASHPMGFVSAVSRPTVQFHVIARIANFATLRRLVGRERAACLADDLAARLSGAVPEARLYRAGRNVVEVDFAGEAATELYAALAAMRAACAMPFDLDGEQHVLEVIFGAAAADGHADEVRLVEEAEAALDEAAHGREVVSHVVEAGGCVDAALLADLSRAIDNDEFFLLYQPKVHLRRQEISSAEALIRWQHPTRGLILPGEFIPAIEEGRLIDRMTLWTIERALADRRRLAAAGHELRIFVNISGQLLADEAFVRSACTMVGDDAETIGFEVTETSVILDPLSAIANLQRFADLGIRIAIDDYGAGLSSLAYLKQLPATELKIDKLFVTQLTSSNRDPLIVRSTIDLAHALDMEVVAEGVEAHAAMALLTVMGCDMAQGFLISRPITLDALIGFLGEDVHRALPDTSLASFSRLAGAWKRS